MPKSKITEINSNFEIIEIPRDIDIEKQQLKQDFLKNLGSSSSKKLYQNDLRSSFIGDAFKENNENIFFKFHEQCGHKSLDFVGDFLWWGEQKLNASLDGRFPIAIINSAFLLGAFAINVFVSPVAGIATALGFSSLAALAEGNFKRNIASFGHLEKHFGNKIYKASQQMLKNSGLEAGFNSKIDDQTSKSFFLRLMSYLSSFVISVVEKSLSRFSELTELALFTFAAVLGSIVPILPVINYHLVDFAAKSRHKTAQSEYLFFIQTVEQVFNQIDDINKLQNLTQNFNLHLTNSDLHGNIYGDKNFHQSNSLINPDRPTNPKKWITFSSWLFSKVLQKLFNSNSKYIEDITQFDPNKKDYFDNILAHDKTSASLVFCGPNSDNGSERAEDLVEIDRGLVTKMVGSVSPIYLSSVPQMEVMEFFKHQGSDPYGGVFEGGRGVPSASPLLQQNDQNKLSTSPASLSEVELSVSRADSPTTNMLKEILASGNDFGLVYSADQDSKDKSIKNTRIYRALG